MSKRCVSVLECASGCRSTKHGRLEKQLLSWIHGVLVGDRREELRDEISNLVDAIAHGALRSSPTLAERLTQAELKLAAAEVAQGGSAVALKRDAERTQRKDEPEARHKAEVERMRAVIAEITAENLELKKKV